MEFCSLRGRGRDQMHNFPSCSLRLLHPLLRRHRSISLGMFKIFLKALRGFCWSSIPLSWWLNSTWELLGNVGSGFFPFSIPKAHSWWISESPELQHKVLLFQKVVEPLFFSPASNKVYCFLCLCLALWKGELSTAWVILFCRILQA